jgi:predicted permease
MGREIESEEDRPGGPAVAVVSHIFWKRALQSDPEAIGRKILLRGEPYTVVGVMPDGFNTLPPVDLWTPLRPSTKGEGGGSNYALIARIRPGSAWLQANAELSALGASYVADNHINLSPGSFIRFRLMSMQQAMADDFRVPLTQPLMLLWAAVGVILLIGCINVAALMLARSGTRRHEIATRLALGSGRRGILGQLLAENLLIALAGGAGGLFLGYWCLAGLRWLVAQSLELKQPMAIDFRVLAMTAFAALIASVLFGLYPAWEATRVDIRTSLSSTGRSIFGPRRTWPRRALVVCEVALGTVLLISAGLMLRTLSYFTGLNAGYDGHEVLTANLSLQDARYSMASDVNRLFDESLARIRQYPGVQAAGVGLTLPYQRALNDGARVLDGPHAMPDNREVNITYVTPGYFEALRIPLVRGRLLNVRDQSNSARVAIVNEAFVKSFFKGDSPLSSHLSFNKDVEIVGVVGDVPVAGFSDPLATIPNIYVPASQQTDAFFQLVHTWFTPSWVVRASGPQTDIARGMSAAMAAADPQLPFAAFRTMDEVRYKSFALQSLESALLGTLAGLALLLAVIGIYGLIAHSVTERVREFGIRIALGASVSRAISQAVQPAIVLTAAGVAIGYALARWSSAMLKSVVYGVQLTDGATYATVIAVLLLAGVCASIVPSLRIARIDPARTLRDE